MRTLAALLLCAAGLHAEPPRYIPDDPPVYVSERTGSRTDAVPAPAYRWTTETPGQLTLWQGAKQVGAWREADGVYLSYPGWAVAELPTELPKSQLYRVKKTELSAWLSHPLNVGSCPCAQAGGCRCSPHDNCKGGKCAEQNPYLSAAAVKVGPPRTQPQYVPVLQGTR